MCWAVRAPLRAFFPSGRRAPVQGEAFLYAIISYSRSGRTHFAGDPRDWRADRWKIARHPVTVIGVAPKGFVVAAPGLRLLICWVPLDSARNRRLADNRPRLQLAELWWEGYGREWSREQVNQDLETIMRRIVAAYPDDHLGTNTITLGSDVAVSRSARTNIWRPRSQSCCPLRGSVLLLTCANVATLGTGCGLCPGGAKSAIRRVAGCGSGASCPADECWKA